MAEVKAVTASIDKAREQVVLTPQNDVLSPLDTFLVAGGDTLRWDLAAPLPQGFEAVVTFVAFPKGPPQQLLNEGNSLRTSGRAMQGTVSPRAAKGHYRYRFLLVSPSQTIELKCFWTPGAGQPPEPTGMGGGEKSGDP